MPKKIGRSLSKKKKGRSRVRQPKHNTSIEVEEEAAFEIKALNERDEGRWWSNIRESQTTFRFISSNRCC
jgi:hypothetical protein